ncbi:DUF7663 domain-containing protein [Aquirufa novilacunae]|uniref:DUF7663 domain-containing protein n=1 Tax=Aquirufa novilacunae TaxID=3139305 RepID=A0ABW8U3U1_9BACT
MANIIDIFTKESQALIQYNFPELSSGFETCWYPSACHDFLPVNKFKKDKNVIFVYNDMLAINDMFAYERPNPLFFPGKFISREIYKGDIEVLWYWELKLEEICWNPNRTIWDSSITMKEPKVYLFKIRSNPDAKIIPLIYLSFENTNFFYDYVLHYNVQIETLIHINDGGMSLGCSRYKMDYIYLNLDKIGTKEIWVDYTFKDKKKHILDFSRFEHYTPKSLRVKYLEEDESDYRREEEHERRFRHMEYELGIRNRFEEPPIENSIVERLFTEWELMPISPRIQGYHYVKKSCMANLNLL